MRSRRRQLEWSQADLARRVGVGRAWINQVEQVGPGGLERILRLLAALGLEMHLADAAPAQFEARRSDEPRPSQERIRERRALPELPKSALHYPIYTIADLSLFSPDQSRFYDDRYLPLLRQMYAAVVEQAAPIFDDILASQLARAHGFAGVRLKIGERIRLASDPNLPRSREGRRFVIWPKGSKPRSVVPFRSADADTRRHGDVPLAELAGLARSLRESGCSDNQVLEQMRKTFGLSRLVEATRRRFEAAIVASHER